MKTRWVFGRGWMPPGWVLSTSFVFGGLVGGRFFGYILVPAWRARVSPLGGGGYSWDGRKAQAMAGLTDREKIAPLAPDLQGLLDSRRVPEATQAGLHDLGIDNLAMLSAVAIDRTSLETLARSSLGIDVTARPADAIIFASLFLAWQSATKRMEARNELEAEAVATEGHP